MLWEKTKRGEKKGGLRITLLNMLSYKLYLPIVRKVTQHTVPRADPNAQVGVLSAKSQAVIPLFPLAHLVISTLWLGVVTCRHIVLT
jgi:hypothetical protein